jgi:hypothetical protein
VVGWFAYTFEKLAIFIFTASLLPLKIGTLAHYSIISSPKNGSVVMNSLAHCDGCEKSPCSRFVNYIDISET